MEIKLRDVISGLVTPIIIVTSTLSYVAFIFSGPLAGTFPFAVGFGLISAGLMAIVFALGSSVPFAIAGPDSKPTAVLAIMAALVAERLSHGTPPADIGLVVLAALVVGTLATGIALFALGTFRLGKWIRFVPYPVIGGFMAASGWLLAVGGVGLLAGAPISLSTLQEVATGPHLPQIAAGLGFAAAVWLVQRVQNPFAFPILLVAAIVIVHLILLDAGFSIAAARDAGWLLNVGAGGELASPLALLQSVRSLDLVTIGRASGEFVGLVAVTVMTLLLSLVVIEVESRLDVDVDRELRLNGLANILVGLVGGMVGTISVSRSLFNYRIGARGRASGVIAGIFCLAVLAFGTGALTYLPLPILGGLLIAVGAEMLNEWLILGRRTMPVADYVQVIMIMLAIVWWDFVAGVAVGIVAACVTFAVNTSRIRLVKQGLDRSRYRSRVDRPIAHEETLLQHGKNIQIIWLHGFVFFGSAHRLLLDVQQLVDTAGHATCRSLILDFGQVLGIDSSAALNLGKLWNFAEREGFVIALSSVSPVVENALRAGGLLDRQDSMGRLFQDVDTALEWCEDNLIAERLSKEEQLRSADEWLEQEIGSSELFIQLVSYLEQLEFATGEYIFKQGAPADALFLMHTGRVSILYETPQGGELRLRNMVGPTVLGEMGLYRSLPRGASVRVDRARVVYRLSSEALAYMEADTPSAAYAFHKFIVRVLASRLEFANREIVGLQS
jgi:SulP family sulfate permease